MFQEWYEGRSDRYELLRRDIHIVDAILGHERHVALLAAEDEVFDERAMRVDAGVRLRDDRVFLAIGVEPRDLTRHLAVLHDEVGRLDEAQIVHPRIARERRDEADVRTFWRLDRAHAAVLRVVHVAHLEAGALARETTRTERR